MSKLAGAPIRFPGCSVACAAVFFSGMAAAEYPEKPIRIVTPFPAGSVADVVARPIATHLAETWSQPVVVDNRGGAGGTIAAEIVAKSLPDGHTLLIGANGPNAVNPSLLKNLPYDSQRAFAAITIAATTNFLLTVTSSTPVKSVRDLIELARSKPGQLRYASPGVGSSPHLAGELFKSLARVDMVHVPYKGSTQYLVDMVSGRVDLCICGAGPLLPHIKAGRLRLIAVSAGTRDPTLPGVPTISEEGVPGFDVVGWFGLLAPAGTPAPVVRKLHGEVVRILAQASVKAIYLNSGLETLSSSSPAEFGEFIRRERDKWAKVIKAANIRIE
jgi:tripartite-type tricarboxylate transporter receptor subunit TctC